MLDIKFSQANSRGLDDIGIADEMSWEALNERSYVNMPTQQVKELSEYHLAPYFFDDARNSPIIPLEEANERGKEWGGRFTQAPTEYQFELYRKQKEAENQRELILSKSSSGFNLFGADVGRFLYETGVGMLDPLNLATMAIATSPAAAARYMQAYGRVGGRALAGAQEGIVAGILLEPINALSIQHRGHDYDAYTMLASLGVQGVFGAGFRVIGGAGYDAMARAGLAEIMTPEVLERIAKGETVPEYLYRRIKGLPAPDPLSDDVALRVPFTVQLHERAYVIRDLYTEKSRQYVSDVASGRVEDINPNEIVIARRQGAEATPPPPPEFVARGENDIIAEALPPEHREGLLKHTLKSLEEGYEPNIEAILRHFPEADRLEFFRSRFPDTTLLASKMDGAEFAERVGFEKAREISDSFLDELIRRSNNGVDPATFREKLQHLFNLYRGKFPDLDDVRVRFVPTKADLDRQVRELTHEYAPSSPEHVTATYLKEENTIIAAEDGSLTSFRHEIERALNDMEGRSLGEMQYHYKANDIDGQRVHRLMEAALKSGESRMLPDDAEAAVREVSTGQKRMGYVEGTSEALAAREKQLDEARMEMFGGEDGMARLPELTEIREDIDRTMDRLAREGNDIERFLDEEEQALLKKGLATPEERKKIDEDYPELEVTRTPEEEVAKSIEDVNKLIDQSVKDLEDQLEVIRQRRAEETVKVYEREAGVRLGDDKPSVIDDVAKGTPLEEAVAKTLDEGEELPALTPSARSSIEKAVAEAIERDLTAELLAQSKQTVLRGAYIKEAPKKGQKKTGPEGGMRISSFIRGTAGRTKKVKNADGTTSTVQTQAPTRGGINPYFTRVARDLWGSDANVLDESMPKSVVEAAVRRFGERARTETPGIWTRNGYALDNPTLWSRLAEAGYLPEYFGDDGPPRDLENIILERILDDLNGNHVYSDLYAEKPTGDDEFINRYVQQIRDFRLAVGDRGWLSENQEVILAERLYELQEIEGKDVTAADVFEEAAIWLNNRDEEINRSLGEAPPSEEWKRLQEIPFFDSERKKLDEIEARGVRAPISSMDAKSDNAGTGIATADESAGARQALLFAGGDGAGEILEEQRRIPKTAFDQVDLQIVRETEGMLEDAGGNLWIEMEGANDRDILRGHILAVVEPRSPLWINTADGVMVEATPHDFSDAASMARIAVTAHLTGWGSEPRPFSPEIEFSDDIAQALRDAVAKMKTLPDEEYRSLVHDKAGLSRRETERWVKAKKSLEADVEAYIQARSSDAAVREPARPDLPDDVVDGIRKIADESSASVESLLRGMDNDVDDEISESLMEVVNRAGEILNKQRETETKAIVSAVSDGKMDSLTAAFVQQTPIMRNRGNYLAAVSNINAAIRRHAELFPRRSKMRQHMTTDVDNLRSLFVSLHQLSKGKGGLDKVNEALSKIEDIPASRFAETRRQIGEASPAAAGAFSDWVVAFRGAKGSGLKDPLRDHLRKNGLEKIVPPETKADVSLAALLQDSDAKITPEEVSAQLEIPIADARRAIERAQDRGAMARGRGRPGMSPGARADAYNATLDAMQAGDLAAFREVATGLHRDDLRELVRVTLNRSFKKKDQGIALLEELFTDGRMKDASTNLVRRELPKAELEVAKRDIRIEVEKRLTEADVHGIQAVREYMENSSMALVKHGRLTSEEAQARVQNAVDAVEASKRGITVEELHAKRGQEMVVYEPQERMPTIGSERRMPVTSKELPPKPQFDPADVAHMTADQEDRAVATLSAAIAADKSALAAIKRELAELRDMKLEAKGDKDQLAQLDKEMRDLREQAQAARARLSYNQQHYKHLGGDLGDIPAFARQWTGPVQETQHVRNQQAVLRQVDDGTFSDHVIDDDTLAHVVDILSDPELARMIPKDVHFVAYFGAAKIDDSTYRVYHVDRDKMARYIDMAPDEYLEYVDGTRAMQWEIGNLPAIILTPFSVDGLSRRGAKLVLFHELSHLYRNYGAYGQLFEALLDFSNSRRILDFSHRRFLELTDSDMDPRGFAEDSIRQDYLQGYALSGYSVALQREMMKQEAVSFLAELYAAGAKIPGIEQVSDILDAIGDGRLARAHEQRGQTRSLLRDVEADAWYGKQRASHKPTGVFARSRVRGPQTDEPRTVDPTAELKGVFSGAPTEKIGYRYVKPVAPVRGPVRAIDPSDFIANWMKWTRDQQERTDRIADKSGKSHTVEVRPGRGTLEYTVMDGDEPVGSFYVRSGGEVPSTVSVMNVEVEAPYQRKGVASAVYDMIERDVAGAGARLAPHGLMSMSPDAVAFWRARNPKVMEAMEAGRPVAQEDLVTKPDPAAVAARNYATLNRALARSISEAHSAEMMARMEAEATIAKAGGVMEEMEVSRRVLPDNTFEYRVKSKDMQGVDTSTTLYHGTPKKHVGDRFIPRQFAGKGPPVVWLTPDKNMSNYYNGSQSQYGPPLIEDGASTIPVHIRPGRQLVVNGAGTHADGIYGLGRAVFGEEIKAEFSERRSDLRALLNEYATTHPFMHKRAIEVLDNLDDEKSVERWFKDASYYGENYKQYVPEHETELLQQLEVHKWLTDIAPEQMERLYKSSDNKKITTSHLLQWAKDNGYDSIRFDNMWDTGGLQTQYAVFDEKNIVYKYSSGKDIALINARVKGDKLVIEEGIVDTNLRDLDAIIAIHRAIDQDAAMAGLVAMPEKIDKMKAAAVNFWLDYDPHRFMQALEADAKNVTNPARYRTLIDRARDASQDRVSPAMRAAISEQIKDSVLREIEESEELANMMEHSEKAVTSLGNCFGKGGSGSGE